jgi:predicted SnoaL-like aldol condensation-catalyzing enzyme
MVVEGNIVATRSRITGAGALFDGKDLTLMEMFRIEDGRIVELWGNASPEGNVACPQPLLASALSRQR